MSPEQIRIAIAEACGWTNITSDLVGIPPNSRGTADAWHVPDYCHDLNACHEMEKTLTAIEWPEYRLNLTELCASYRLPEWQGFAISAEPHRRCEAFLRTIGKWKEHPMTPDPAGTGGTQRRARDL